MGSRQAFPSSGLSHLCGVKQGGSRNVQTGMGQSLNSFNALLASISKLSCSQ